MLQFIQDLLNDSYLIFADSGQGKVYQISIDYTRDEIRTLAYNIVPLGEKSRF